MNAEDHERCGHVAAVTLEMARSHFFRNFYDAVSECLEGAVGVYDYCASAGVALHNALRAEIGEYDYYAVVAFYAKCVAASANIMTEGALESLARMAVSKFAR